MIVYVGADDCAPCRTWNRDHRPKFTNSPEFSRLVYREIKSPTLLDVLKDDFWPAELRDYRDTLGRAAGVPVWFVVVDGKIALTAGGVSQWEVAVLPKIRSLVR